VYGTVRTVVWEDGGSDPASYPITTRRVKAARCSRIAGSVIASCLPYIKPDGISESNGLKPHTIIRDIQLGRLPTPKVHLIESDTSNVFATGRNSKHGAVAVTT
jgi:hypothetical protein